MALTWGQVFGISGERYSEIIDISNSYSEIEATISWGAIVPSGCTFLVQTNVSLDDGVTWRGWETAVNGGYIAGINGQGDFTNAKFQFRYIYTIPDGSNSEIQFQSTNIRMFPIITFVNSGHKPIRPEMWLKKIGNGDVEIVNQRTGKSFKMTGLADNETLYINGKLEQIKTDIPATYRFNNHNGVFVECVRGHNKLKVIGACEIRFRYQFTYIK